MGTSETMCQDSTFEIPTKFRLGKSRHGVIFPSILPTEGEKSLEVDLYHSVECGISGISGMIGSGKAFRFLGDHHEDSGD
jgi:hypothetical protein